MWVYEKKVLYTSCTYKKAKNGGTKGKFLLCQPTALCTLFNTVLHMLYVQEGVLFFQ